MSVIENLKPKLVWKHFDQIRKIPRCSKRRVRIQHKEESVGPTAARLKQDTEREKGAGSRT